MMKQALQCLAFSASMLACVPAGAALSPDPTGLWYDPAESGWGLTLAQQGDTVFAVLFVYDQANHPAWYVASEVQAPASNPPGGPIVTGTLYRTMGPWFGGAFDPHAVGMAPVGTLTLQYVGPGQQSLQVGYVIDGTAVSKSVQPQTWRDASALLPGTYEGGLWITGKSATTCEDLGFGPFDAVHAFNFQVLADAPDVIRFLWGTGIDTVCVAIGQYAQRGQLGSITGTIGCGDITTIAATNTGPSPSQLQLTGLAINEHGFAGAASVLRGSCTYTGHIGGVRHP
jgi:hypothetical protein